MASSSRYTRSGAGRPVPILNISNGVVNIIVPTLKEIFKKKVGRHPFVLYSVNGEKRTGKSFFLSNCVRYLNHHSINGELTSIPTDDDNTDWITDDMNSANFEWRTGAERHTTGIDIWSEPYWIKDERTGHKVALILMDTQGCFDAQTTTNTNAIIFAISTLLSSVLIFNVMRDLGENVLQFFHLFSRFATLSLNDSEESLQKLIFLIRDFAFPMDYSYGYHDDESFPRDTTHNKNFKKEKLNPHRSQAREVRDLHKEIVQTYQDIGVYLMPMPNHELMYEAQVDNLEPEFSQHLASFIRLIFKNSKTLTKKVGGVEVTGKEMIRYVESWAKLFSGTKLPEIKGIFESAAQNQFVLAKQAAILAYSKEMRSFMDEWDDGVSKTQFSREHAVNYNEALEIFKSRNRLGSSSFKKECEETLEEEVQQLYDVYKEENAAKRKAADKRKALEEMEKENERLKKELRRKERREQTSSSRTRSPSPPHVRSCDPDPPPHFPSCDPPGWPRYPPGTFPGGLSIPDLLPFPDRTRPLGIPRPSDCTHQ